MSLPQLVPSRVCLGCDVCCRFPEPNSFLRPYFTEEEIKRAVGRGIDPAHFSDSNGCQVSVVPNPSGDGYLCPAFDPATSHCRIYEDRPLDCQVYPLAVMWAPPAAAGEGREARGEELEVVLGWDTKCPFLREGLRFEVGGSPSLALPTGGGGKGWGRLAPEIVAYADRVAALIEDQHCETFVKNPRLIGKFQEDVVVLKPLPRLTARMKEQFEVRGSGFTASTSNIELRTLHPLTLEDRSRFAQAFARVDTELAHYALAPHLIWRHLFTYNWAEIEGCLCLFAEYADGLFMPLPPLPVGEGKRLEARGQRTESSPLPLASCPSPAALAACFALMRARNGGRAVSRIENVPHEWGARLEAMGYGVRPKDPDYLYRTADLVALAGDRYKSQRAACNRFEREHRHALEPYRDADGEACQALFRDWSAQKRAAGLEEGGRHMLADSEAAHREALARHHELGLVGSVVRVDGHIRAYTFGYERSPSVFCVLLEVADRSVPGLAPWIFRACCREAAGRGHAFINTMDDSGLPGLARSKRAYHPLRLVSSYIVTEL